MGRGVGAESQYVIPENLDALLGNRERNSPDRSRDSIAARGQIRRGGDALGGIVNPLRHRGAAMRRVHDHLVVFVSLEQPLVPFRELRGVFVHVGRGDGEQGLVGGERIGVELTGLVVGEPGLRRRFDPAGPGRDGAVRIAGLLRSQRREIVAEACGFLRAHGAPRDVRA